MSTVHVDAVGEINLIGNVLTWAGSRTGRTAECYVYGNGNVIITHDTSLTTGSIRSLDEDSRYTPMIEPDSDKIDIGFEALENGEFLASGMSETGRIDLFKYDLVVRCEKPHYIMSGPNRAHIITIGPIKVDMAPESAVTAGPSLLTPNFSEHSINSDPSLGGKPPFTERRMARMVLYHTAGGLTHLRLYDGRPGSKIFTGLTPTEAYRAIDAEDEVVWGCFLDPGQTAKLCVSQDDSLNAYGNRHYLQWPSQVGDSYVWVPDRGRPTSSIISLH